MKRVLYLLLVVLVCTAGCMSKKPPGEKSAEVLKTEGLAQFEKRDYHGARLSFQKIRDWYPFSEHNVVAEIKIADCHYYMGEYDEAALAYEEFSNLHPRNDATPYAIYQLGRCHFERIPTIDRDQTFARQALEVFTRFVQRYPDSVYAGPARAHIKDCQQSLASHELYVARFYFEQKRYAAALQRLQAVVTDYPDVGVQHEALQMISACKALAAAAPPAPAPGDRAPE